KSVKIYIHEVVLSYSRKKYWNYSLSITSEDIIRAICLGINYFNGVPLELVIDNPKQMIITHRKDGVVRYNDDFLRFCGLYGIEPSPCRNYRARTKGKVERPFYYIQEHLLRGLELNEISEFDNKLNEFMEGYNLRLHSSLKESPDNRFEKESPNLREIPVVEPQILHKRETRKVTNDGYVSFDGSFYPVPMKRCLSELWVESFLGRIIKIYEPSGELISSFWINPFDKGIRPVHPEHKIINEVYAAKKREIKNALVTRFITLFGSVGEGYIAGLREATGANTYWHLSQILACCEVYTTEVISEVLKECIKVGAYHKNSVLRLLKPYSLKAIPSCLPFSHHGLHVEGVSRPLAFYAGIKEVCHE
ncbi:MAG: transposase family protein, partial [Nitrospirae bacterium]|nr:transposase family protein [Nitrospirota bacterium]